MGRRRVVLQGLPGVEDLDAKAERYRSLALEPGEEERIVTPRQRWNDETPRYVAPDVRSHRSYYLSRYLIRHAQAHLHCFFRHETRAIEANLLPALCLLTTQMHHGRNPMYL